MSDRVVCKIFCGHNHRLGAVFAGASGIRIEYQGAVASSSGSTSTSEVWRPSGGVAESSEAWCRHCRKRYPIFLSMLAQESRRQVFLTPEGMWSDPVGVLERRKHSPDD